MPLKLILDDRAHGHVRAAGGCPPYRIRLNAYGRQVYLWRVVAAGGEFPYGMANRSESFLMNEFRPTGKIRGYVVAH